MERKIIRGDIFIADFNHVIGSEQGNLIPVLVIQNNMRNIYSPTVIIAIIKSQVKKVNIPTHIELNIKDWDLPKDSVVLMDQIHTIYKQRLICHIGTLDKVFMEKANYALSISIGLNYNTNPLLILCLCHSCAKQFYDSSDYTIKRIDINQKEKDTCTYCNMRLGYDFEIKHNLC